MPARLRAVAGMVPPGSRVADIGTDHAYLPLYLAGSDRCPLVIAVEAAPGPYQRALAAVAAAGLKGRVEVRLGDGLAPLQPGEVDTVTMAGLGALTQQRILAARPGVRQGLKRLVLQPQGEAGPLRRYLAATGWYLYNEELVYESGRYYIILAACQGASPSYSDLEWRIGPLLLQRRHPLLRDYLLHKMETLTAAVQQLAAGRGMRARERREDLSRQLAEIREVLAWLPNAAKL
ncbi:tRNA (adenine(22)-N(1))-methyltransferase [Neomoorella glycerini]|uniref:tRNA (Adenine(22)-N(1))-methyltransferase n=1 Tax=Neomoorella glycerini TaxID=55779 RepID=A0A6I5ZS54_9FIRM|nr:class I SAM-dependent methyltransferase [Moorella glycerini]QGP92566.1 tRNA (adenine(22)-N(1))-methyltransferase [Moorella glycerini]